LLHISWLSKAFDTVNHNILFDKFYHNFGIRGIPLQLFRSYLSNRKQFVKLENVKSGSVDISNGVPQGSVLGPLLFIMYINDLPNSSAFYTVLHADDTYLCLSYKNLDNLQHLVNVELIKVDKWLRSNKLFLNYYKSTFMLTWWVELIKETGASKERPTVLKAEKMFRLSEKVNFVF